MHKNYLIHAYNKIMKLMLNINILTCQYIVLEIYKKKSVFKPQIKSLRRLLIMPNYKGNSIVNINGFDGIGY